MGEFKMTRNASGYYDETAYKGIMATAKPGEIWECNNGNNTAEFLIIKNHNRICTALKLVDIDNEYAIAAGCKSVDPRSVQYIFNDTLVRRTTDVTEAFFNNILCEIGRALGLPAQSKAENGEKETAEDDDGIIYLYDVSDLLAEMLELFGRETVEHFLVCSVYGCRFYGNERKARTHYAALKKLRQEKGEGANDKS